MVVDSHGTGCKGELDVWGMREGRRCGTQGGLMQGVPEVEDARRDRGAGCEGGLDPEVWDTGEPEVREKTRRSIYNWLPSAGVGLLSILLTYKKTALTGL